MHDDPYEWRLLFYSGHSYVSQRMAVESPFSRMLQCALMTETCTKPLLAKLRVARSGIRAAKHFNQSREHYFEIDVPISNAGIASSAISLFEIKAGSTTHRLAY
jgi:hypothetical protein